MVEYAFDAHIIVEEETSEAALDLILDHCMDADIAVSLHEEGTLNVRNLGQWIKVEDSLPPIPPDAVTNTPIVSGPFWLFLPSYEGTKRGPIREGVLWADGNIWGRWHWGPDESSRYASQPTHWLDGQRPGWKPALPEATEDG